MPTFIAICPYCRAGGVRAPSGAAGASATCPKCKSNFTLAPEEHLPGWATVKPSAVPAKPLPPAVAETRSTAALPDVTEPSPVIPSEPYTAPAVSPVPIVSADSGLALALAALALVGPAVLVSQLPFGRAAALIVGAFGAAAGLLCLGADGRSRNIGALAAAAHATVVFVVLLLPSWLNLDPWSGADEPEQSNQPIVVERASSAPTSLNPSDWLDADKYAWQFHDLRVSARATVGPLPRAGAKGARRTPNDVCLFLTIRLTNTGLESPLALTGWASNGTDAVRVTDADGAPLAPTREPNGTRCPHTCPQTGLRN